jgi:hypothetical protein
MPLRVQYLIIFHLVILRMHLLEQSLHKAVDFSVKIGAFLNLDWVS